MGKDKFSRVAVLMGGISKEREISLKSGRAVAAALTKKGYDVVEVDLNGPDAVLSLKNIKVEAAYIALHGKYGEDGTIQGVLEWLQIPYTGPAVASSALCFDKLATKKFLAAEGILTPPYAVFTAEDHLEPWLEKHLSRFLADPNQRHRRGEGALPAPLIVKPNTEGSSIGLTKVKNASELQGALLVALKFDKTILVERFISGREITVGVHNGKALPIVEIVPKSGLYDFEAKYTVGKTEYIVPARISEPVTKEIQEMSEKIYGVLGCDSAVRVDFICPDKEGAQFLEVNTIPGMTETSLLPKAAAQAGLDFDDLCEEILQTAKLKVNA